MWFELRMLREHESRKPGATSLKLSMGSWVSTTKAVAVSMFLCAAETCFPAAGVLRI